MKLLLLFLLVFVAAEFEPKTRDLRLSLLVKNVLLDSDRRPCNLEYADFTAKFEKLRDKLGYIMQTSELAPNLVTDEPRTVHQPHFVHRLGLGSVYSWYQTNKQKISSQLNKIRSTLQNPQAYSVYLVETTGDIYLLVVSSKLEFETLDLIDWYNLFIGDNWGKRRWCELFDPWNQITVVVAGEDPWAECNVESH